MGDDPYAILGVERGATDEEIRAAYLAGAKRLHPDVVGEAESGEKMRELNLAYEVLRDPGLRAEYDAENPIGRGISTDLEKLVKVWVDDGRLEGLENDKMQVLNREFLQMEKEGWTVRHDHDHLVCTKTERVGLFRKPIKRRVTVNIDKHGLPFRVEQKRPE